MSIDFFLILLVPMLWYGWVQKVWIESKTTFIVIVSFFTIAFSAKYFKLEIILLETYLFLMFLFVRAVFRTKFKKVKNPILRGIFYA